MADRVHWSYSSLSQYLRCPLQYFFQRVIGIPQKTIGSQLVLGGAVHAALETYHIGLQQEQPRSQEQIESAFLAAWQTREEQGVLIFKAGETRSDNQEQGLTLIGRYLQEPPPANIVAVEQKLLTPICNSHGEFLETPLMTVADLITRQDGQLVIDEFKTSGKAYSEFEADTTLQATSYVNMAHQVYGEDALFRFTILVKTKTPKVQRLNAVRTESDVGRMGDLIQNIERSIAANIFFPIESPMHCCTCPYRQPCRDWGTRAEVNQANQQADIFGTEAKQC